MSFIPPFGTMTNGTPIDAQEIEAALERLAAFARLVHADLAGPSWVGGMAPQVTTVKNNTVPAVTIGAGVCMPVDAGVAYDGVTMDLGVRSRMPLDATIELPLSTERLIVASADTLSDTLSVVWPAPPSAIPDGAVPLAYVVTDAEKVTQLTDARAGAWQWQISPGGSGTSVQQLTEFLWLPDTTIAVVLRQTPSGVEAVHLHFEATVQNKTDQYHKPYPEVQFQIFSRRAANEQGVPAFAGTYAFGSAQRDQILSPTGEKKEVGGGKCQIWWDGIYAPAQEGGADKTGVHFLDVRVRAADAEVSDVVFQARRILGDRRWV